MVCLHSALTYIKAALFNKFLWRIKVLVTSINNGSHSTYAIIQHNLE